MNNKAFTLIELLAVIVILALLATIATPNIINSINVSREKAYERQKKAIEEAAERWGVDNQEELSEKVENDEPVTIKELKEKGYIDKKISDPSTKDEMTGCVQIKKNDNNYTYEYSNEECPNEEE